MKIKKERLGWHIQPETNEEREKIEWLLDALHHRYGVVAFYVEEPTEDQESPAEVGSELGNEPPASNSALAGSMYLPLLSPSTAH